MISLAKKFMVHGLVLLVALSCLALPGWAKKARKHVPAPPLPVRAQEVTPERHGVHKMRIKAAKPKKGHALRRKARKAVPVAGTVDIPSDGKVLIVYDAVEPYGWLGELHSQMLSNLMSHFNLDAEIKPAGEYVAGEIESYRATFYLGTTYGAPLTDAFLDDVQATNKPICWMGMNLWQLAWTETWAPNAEFESKFGFRFAGLDGTPYTQVSYKGATLARNINLQSLGLAAILDPSKAAVYATAITADNSKSAPYILRGANFWYVGDSPFSYVDHSDRYLAFADLLHDILGINHTEQHRSLVRLEDISPMTPSATLKDIADYLGSAQVPFAMTVIPAYRDPHGVYNNGVPTEIDMSSREARPYVKALKYMMERGGGLIQHGYTHQYDEVANPYYSVTAEDFEFFRMALDGTGKSTYVGPVPEDSAAWAQDRVTTGYRLFKAVGLTPIAWETPHYMASEADYAVFAKSFTLATDRGVYFATGDDGTVYYVCQMAPYIIPSDIYGQKRLPDTLGYIDPDGSGSITGTPSLSADLVNRAQTMQVVRDGWANFYYHWDLDLNYLKDTVAGLKALGVQFCPLDPTVQ